MMNKMKNTYKVVALVVCVLIAVLLVACKTVSKPQAIYFDKSNTPRQTYVQGQELALSGSSLT